MLVQRCSRIAILLDRLRLALRFRVRLSEIDVRNPLVAPAVVSTQEQQGCSTEHAPRRGFYFSSASSL
jgi:hypothetical protein